MTVQIIKEMKLMCKFRVVSQEGIRHRGTGLTEGSTCGTRVTLSGLKQVSEHSGFPLLDIIVIVLLARVLSLSKLVSL
jgi:hypothetical protein